MTKRTLRPFKREEYRRGTDGFYRLCGTPRHGKGKGVPFAVYTVEVDSGYRTKLVPMCGDCARQYAQDHGLELPELKWEAE